MNGPLSGIRVFDLTRVLAGPSCVQILGDLGAEVIKVEQPNVGDDTRKFGPPFLKDMDGNDTTESGYYMATNRNKRSLTLNLTSKKGQDIARQLISKSDILVENFKVGNLSKYNLSYDNLRDEYPSLIYCSITGFGQTGPLAEQPGYDFMAQGMGGLMSVTGPKDGEPHRVGVPIADLTAGLWATIAICAAVRHKEQTGEGQHLDISLLDTQVASLSIQGLNYLTSGDVPQLLGNAHPNIVPYQVFPVADGDIIIAVGNDNQFDRFAKFATVKGTLSLKSSKFIIPLFVVIVAFIISPYLWNEIVHSKPSKKSVWNVNSMEPKTDNLYKIEPLLGFMFKIDNNKIRDEKPTVYRTRTINFQIIGFGFCI